MSLAWGGASNITNFINKNYYLLGLKICSYRNYLNMFCLIAILFFKKYPLINKIKMCIITFYIVNCMDQLERKSPRYFLSA